MVDKRKLRWPVVVAAMVITLVLVGVATAFVLRTWQHDRYSTDGTRATDATRQPSTGVQPAPPSAGELLDTAQCGRSTSTSTSKLTSITAGRHDTFDRIVLAFAGTEPECSAEYATQIVADGSGRPIALEGDAFLRVTLRGAAAHDDAGKMTYSGPDTMDTPELANVTAVALAGDFEGQVSIGVGMNVEAHYTVFALSEPTRVVIDVGH